MAFGFVTVWVSAACLIASPAVACHAASGQRFDWHEPCIGTIVKKSPACLFTLEFKMGFSKRSRAIGAVKGNSLDFSALWQLATRVAGFSILSAIGLTIDIAVFSLFVHFGLRPGYANLISAGLAVTFVYFSSAKKVFQYHGRFLLPLFLIYLLYQVAAVLAASFAVDSLAMAGFKPIVAKLLILPVTFTANYLSMSFLLRARH